MQYLKKIKTVILFLILSINLSAQDYYVDQVNGSNSNSGTSPSNAFKDFGDAVDAVSPGGTIYIIGEYHNRSYDPNYTYGSPSDAHLWNAENSIKINGLNGTSDNYITIKGYDDNSVLKGDGANILRVVSSSYLKFEDLNIEGEVENIPLSTANALQFVYIDANTCDATNPSPSDIHYRNEDETNDNDGVVEETDTYTDLSNMDVKRPSYVDTRGFYLSDVNHIDIVNCHIHHTCGGGLRVSDGEYVNIIGNEIDNCSRRSYSGTHALVVTKTHSTNNLDDYKIVIENNIIHHNYNEQYSWAPTKTIITPRIDEGKGISLQRNNTDDWLNGHGRILVKNNLTYWNGFSGVHSNDGDRIDFINNTAFMNSYTNSITYPSGDQAGNNIGISLSGESDNPMQDTKIINNIIVIDTDWNGFPISIANVNTNSSNVKIRNNIVYGINGAVTTDSDVDGIQVATLEQDPKFVNAPATYQNTNYNYDFHLQSNSPAIGYADANYAPALDIEGTTRDANPDAGAYEYTSTSSIPVTSITVQGQGGVSTITTAGGTLQMEATVLPANATDPTYTWSVINGTGQATINTSGVLTAVADGDVTVRATANDGSGVYGEAVITISNQTPSNDMTFQSITVTQASTSDVYPGTTDNEVLKIEIVTTGTDNPLYVTKIRMNLNGSDDLADIDATKAYYTGTTNTFSTNTLFGTMATPSQVTDNKNITGTQYLSEGSNYFWISIDVSSGATVGDVIDARILKVFISDGVDTTDVLNATEQNPAGNRTIVSSTIAPVANFSGTPLSICPGESVTFTDASTNTPTSWLWDFGDGSTSTEQNPTHTYATAGTYTVSLTASNAGGSDTKTNTNYITVNPSTAITSQPSSTAVCEGDNVIFSVTATGSNLSYQWKKGTTNIGTDNATLTITGVSLTDAGDYTCVVTGDCGSVTSDVATLTVNPTTAITTQPTGTTVCEGDNVIFSVTATGSNLSYQWKKGTTNVGTDNATLTITGVSLTDAGDYTCVVTGDCGSVTSDVATLTVNPTTAITSQPSSTTVCEGDNVTFSVTATGSNLSYQWKKGTTNIGTDNATLTITGVSLTDAGDYTCVVTGDCGSVTSDVATLDVNPIAIEPASVSASSSTICEGESTILTYQGGSGDTFNWYTGSCGGTLVGSGNNLSVSPTSTTTYYGRWESTCGNSTCKSVTVTVNTMPVLSVSSTNASCGNTDGTATVSVTGGTGSYTYLWSDALSQTTATATNLGQGVYTVTVTSGACTATGNATVNEDGAPIVSVSASETTICEGETTVLTASGADSYSWSPATGLDATTGTTVNASPTADIMYTVTGTTAGCSASANVNITVNHTPVAGFTVDNSNEPLIIFTNTSTNADSYSWDLGDGTTETTTDVSHEYTSNGTYAVILTASNTCGIDTCNQEIVITITGNGLLNVSNENINVYPNPVNSILNIELPISNVDIQLVNTDGKILKMLKTNQNKNVKINVEDLPDGVYYLIMTSEKNERAFVKIVK